MRTGFKGAERLSARIEDFLLSICEDFFLRASFQSHHCRLLFGRKGGKKKKKDLIISSLLNNLGVSVPQAQHMLVSFVLHPPCMVLKVAVTRMEADGQAPQISSEGGMQPKITPMPNGKREQIYDQESMQCLTND